MDEIGPMVKKDDSNLESREGYRHSKVWNSLHANWPAANIYIYIFEIVGNRNSVCVCVVLVPPIDMSISLRRLHDTCSEQTIPL